MYVTVSQVSLAFNLCFPFLEPPEAAEALTEIAGGGLGGRGGYDIQFLSQHFLKCT